MSVSNLVEQSLAERIDSYFTATRRWDGMFWSIKLPWNKQKTWMKPEAYFQFRYDIAKLTAPSPDKASK